MYACPRVEMLQEAVADQLLPRRSLLQGAALVVDCVGEDAEIRLVPLFPRPTEAVHWGHRRAGGDCAACPPCPARGRAAASNCRTSVSEMGA